MLSGIAAAALTTLCLFLWVTTPRNYLADDPTLPLLGWKAQGCIAELSSAAPPIPGAPVLRLVSTTADGSFDLYTRHLPPGTLVFSVYLRSDRRTTLRLHAYWQDGGEQAVVRVDHEWRRFSLLIADRKASRISVGIGGQESFSEGEMVEIAAPQVSAGSSAPPFAQAHVQDLGWLEWRSEDLGLRTMFAPLGWAALLAGACWLLTFAAVRARLLAARQWFATGWRRTTLVYTGTIVATWIAVEAISFAACVVLATDRLPVAVALQEVWHEGWQGKDRAAIVDAASTTFAPLTQIRRIVGAPQGGNDRVPFVVNRLGLVDNEAPSPDWDVMPAKPAGMVRVILYGGSTAMGVGARDGTETLSAQLERLLNADAAPGTVFQVLNFGHGAAQSYATLQFLASMGAYLKPDISIQLEGFNDAFAATESDVRTGDFPYLINWANYSYYFTNAFGGLERKPARQVPLLNFSALLVARLAEDEDARAAAIKSSYDNMPMRVLSRWLDESGETRATTMAHNLRFIAGYFVNRDEYLLSYLQPHPWQFRVLMTAPAPDGLSEQARVEIGVRRGTAASLEDYKRRMTDVFTAYAGVYADLAQEYSMFANIRFYDIRDLYEDFPKPAYTDIIHYTPAAQKWMAQRMYRDLKSIPLVRQKLRDNIP